VLPILSPEAPVRHEERDTPAAPSRKRCARFRGRGSGGVRTLVKYGMTVAQIAKVYVVAPNEIARILRQA
jgi:hypothetical protein